MKIFHFKNTSNAFNYVFEKDLKANETVIVKMPAVSANKRGINDIGWLSDGNVTLYGTLANHPESEKALWQEILVNNEINKVTSALKIVNNGDACRIEIRAIFN
ncbi:MAG: hypothetical protein IIW54_12740 [Lachnospiraceae bacterium]|nr:hypothetical protein [Lachnospiraceae bacterium]